MNTTTTQETFALVAAIPAQSMLLVPLSQLRPPKRKNVRNTAGAPITALAASIERVGLLQNLTVVLADDGEHYEVVAGNRRLAALKLLAKTHRIAKDYAVPCLQLADASALTASLTENVQREAMHPADQYEAFAALVAEGRPIEDIAADFGVEPITVKRRLKLANVSPRLMADYRTGHVTLEQLMALAITDDHTAQEAAFYESPQWQRSALALRDHLTEREVDAYRHPLARFVGIEAYEAAGGAIHRDLFAEGEDGVYMTNAALLEQLAQGKLAEVVATVAPEGWAWVQAAPTATRADLQVFQRAPMETRQPTAREAKRRAALVAKVEKIGHAIEAAIDGDDEQAAEVLQGEGEALGEQLDELDASLLTYSPTVRSAAGVVVTLDHQGEPVIHRGLLREAEAKALRVLTQPQGGASEDGEGEAGPAKAAISAKLAQRLSAHRTGALQVELARHPQAALAALLHGMVRRLFQSGYAGALPVGVSSHPQDRLHSVAADWEASPAAAALEALREAWAVRLPMGDDAALFSALLALTQDEAVQLLALCVASTVDVVTGRAQELPGALLAQAVGLDMRAWWTPTAKGYFDHVTKDVILRDVQQFAPDHAARLAKSSAKKAELAREAERLATGTGWLPSMLVDSPDVQAEASPEPEDDATQAIVA